MRRHCIVNAIALEEVRVIAPRRALALHATKAAVAVLFAGGEGAGGGADPDAESRAASGAGA